MRIGKIKTEILVNFVVLFQQSLEQREIVSINHIVEALGCCRGTAYNYRRALRRLLPSQFPPRRETQIQENLDTY